MLVIDLRRKENKIKMTPYYSGLKWRLIRSVPEEAEQWGVVLPKEGNLCLVTADGILLQTNHIKISVDYHKRSGVSKNGQRNTKLST